MAFFSIVLTIFFIKIINTQNQDLDLNPSFVEEELKGKNAITLSLKIENVPLEFIYPGAKIDIMKNFRNQVLRLAKNVPIAGVSIIDTETVRLVLGVDNGQEENILQNKSDDLFIVLVGDKRIKNKVEIIEVK